MKIGSPPVPDIWDMKIGRIWHRCQMPPQFFTSKNTIKPFQKSSCNEAAIDSLKLNTVIHFTRKIYFYLCFYTSSVINWICAIT